MAHIDISLVLQAVVIAMLLWAGKTIYQTNLLTLELTRELASHKKDDSRNFKRVRKSLRRLESKK